MCKSEMKCACPMGAKHKTMKAAGMMALRLAIALIFVYSGWAKLGAYHEMAATGMASIGLPGNASFWAYLVGGLEVVGGLMILLGVYATYAATWLSVILFVALFTVHIKGSLTDAFMPLAVLGGTLAILGNGAGHWRLVKSQCCCKMCKTAEGACCKEKDNDSCCGGSCGDKCEDKNSCACKNCCGGNCECDNMDGNCSCCKK